MIRMGEKKKSLLACRALLLKFHSEFSVAHHQKGEERRVSDPIFCSRPRHKCLTKSPVQSQRCDHVIREKIYSCDMHNASMGICKAEPLRNDPQKSLETLHFPSHDEKHTIMTTRVIPRFQGNAQVSCNWLYSSCILRWQLHIYFSSAFAT